MMNFNSAVGGITEIKFLISYEFNSYRISVYKHVCNKAAHAQVAHALATVGCIFLSGMKTTSRVCIEGLASDLAWLDLMSNRKL